MPPPLVSICVPTFNGERHIADALTSALLQTYAPVEIVISDSGSTDHTVELCRQLVRESPCPVRIDPDGPKGMAPNWNHVVQMARGKWVKFLFQDDLLERHCIERFVASVARHPRAAFAYSRRHVLLDGPGDAISEHIAAVVDSLHRQPMSAVMSSRRFLGRRSLFGTTTINSIGEPTNVFVRRDVLDREQFNPALRQLIDFEMWLRCCRHGDVVFVPDRLSTFRVHAAQMTHEHLRDAGEFLAREHRNFNRALVDGGTYPFLHAGIRRQIRGEMTRADPDHVPPMTIADRAYAAATDAKWMARRLVGAMRLR